MRLYCIRGTTSKILYEWQIDNIRPSILLWLIVFQYFLSGIYIYSLFIYSLQFILIQLIVYSNLEIKTMLVAVYFAYVILMEHTWGLPQIIKLNATSEPVMKIMAYSKLSCAWCGGKRCSLSTALWQQQVRWRCMRGPKTIVVEGVGTFSVSL